MNKPPMCCTISFNPDVELINLVRDFVSKFYAHAIPVQATAERLAIATHELLENAVRYSVDGETRLHIELGGGEAPSRPLTVRVENRAEERNLGRLRALIDEMRGAGDASAFFQQVIERTADVEDDSGLGLARIWADAGMRLDYLIDRDKVEVIAETTVSVEGAS